jgi:hypothetical protein
MDFDRPPTSSAFQRPDLYFNPGLICQESVYLLNTLTPWSARPLMVV